MEICVLCKESFDDEPPAQVGENGLNTLVRISDEHELCRYYNYRK